jgi:hypothetical protein
MRDGSAACFFTEQHVLSFSSLKSINVPLVIQQQA